jgi:hypothetical protein
MQSHRHAPPEVVLASRAGALDPSTMESGLESVWRAVEAADKACDASRSRDDTVMAENHWMTPIRSPEDFPPEDVHKDPWFVLVGGDSHGMHGLEDVSSRFLEHTSLLFVGDAFERLRSAGVPRQRIITICQLGDYLRHPGIGERRRVAAETRCARLLREGGSDYDFAQVNGGTVFAVCAGLRCARFPRVVPVTGERGPLFLSMYSHGNSHPSSHHSRTSAEMADRARKEAIASQPHMPAPPPPELDHRGQEWFVLMPYPTQPASLGRALAGYICHDAVVNLPEAEELNLISGSGGDVAHGSAYRPHNYLYGTHLRALFARLMAPESGTPQPMVALFNFCRSGGVGSFLQRPATRSALGADKWPLFLIMSAQAGHDALVDGMWSSTTRLLQECIRDREGRTFPEIFREASKEFFRTHVFELSDHVRVRVEPASDQDRESAPFRERLNAALTALDDGSPSEEALREVQRDIPLRKVGSGSLEVDLVSEVAAARKCIAVPESSVGDSEYFHLTPVHEVLSIPDDW